MTRIVCLSDTHNKLSEFRVPNGDVLIHSGDLTKTGSLGEAALELRTMAKLPHKHKLFIAGNHDVIFKKDPGMMANIMKECGITYLQDSGVTIMGNKFWGSPWTPNTQAWSEHYYSKFSLRRGAEILKKWELIPKGTDILITHPPPYAIRDRTVHGDLAGCRDLKGVVNEIKPKFHIFGHIHEGYGSEKHGSVVYVNASSCNKDYETVNPPLIIDL